MLESQNLLNGQFWVFFSKNVTSFYHIFRRFSRLKSRPPKWLTSLVFLLKEKLPL